MMTDTETTELRNRAYRLEFERDAARSERDELKATLEKWVSDPKLRAFVQVHRGDVDGMGATQGWLSPKVCGELDAERDALRAELEASRAQVVAVAHMCRRLLAHARGLPEHGVTNDAEELLADTAKAAAEHDAKVRAEEREQCKKVIWTGEPDGKCGPGAKWGWVARAVYDSMVRAAALEEAAKAIEGLPIWVDQDELRRGLNRAVDAVRALATPPKVDGSGATVNHAPSEFGESSTVEPPTNSAQTRSALAGPCPRCKDDGDGDGYGGPCPTCGRYP